MAKANAKPPSQTEICASIAETTGLSKRDVGNVFDALNDLIKKAVGRSGSKTFAIPGLCKIVVQHKPATKERKGINPFTKEETIFKAKPARNVVKIRPLKKLKDMVTHGTKASFRRKRAICVSARTNRQRTQNAVRLL